MKSKFKQRIVATFLMVLMCANVMQSTLIVYAQNMQMTAEGGGSTDILLALTQEYGEQDGQAMYNSMLDMGIIDENGNKRTYNIIMDGKEYTLSEMEQYLLNTSILDTEKQVYVDNRPVPLSTIAKIIETDNYLKFVENNFLDNKVEMTPEHEASIKSLENQLMNDGISLTSDSQPLTNTKISILQTSQPDLSSTGSKEVTVIFSIANPKEHDFKKYPTIKFKYKTLDSALVAGSNYEAMSGTVEFTQQEQKVQVKIPLIKANTIARADRFNAKSPEKAQFLLALYDIEYASFVRINADKTEDIRTQMLVPMWVHDTYAFEGSVASRTGAKKLTIKQEGELDIVMDTIETNWVYKEIQAKRAELILEPSLQARRRLVDNIYEEATLNFPTENLDLAVDPQTKQSDRVSLSIIQNNGLIVPVAVRRVYNGIPNTTNLGFAMNISFSLSDLYAAHPTIKDELIDGTAMFKIDLQAQAIDSTKKIIIGGEDVGGVGFSVKFLKPTLSEIQTPDFAFRAGDEMPINLRYNQPVTSRGMIKTSWAPYHNIVDDMSLSVGDDYLNYNDLLVKNASYIFKVPNPPTKLTVTNIAYEYNILHNPSVIGDGSGCMEPLQYTDNAEFAGSMKADIKYDEKESLTSIQLTDENNKLKTTPYLPGQKGKIIIDLYENSAPAGNGSTIGAEQNQWLESTTIGEDGETYYVNNLYASYDLGKTKIPFAITDQMDTLIADFTAPTAADNTIGKIILYRNMGTESAKSFVPIQDAGYNVDFIVGDPIMVEATDLSITYPSDYPSGKDKEIELGETGAVSLGYKCVGDGTYKEPTDFSWSSNNENVAVIDHEGKITPVGIGKVTFKLTATNGTTDESKHVFVVTEEFTVIAGIEPVISVGSSVIKKGDIARIMWSTNIMYLNETEIEPPVSNTEFTVELYEGNYKSIGEETPVKTFKKTTNATENATFYELPASDLTKLSLQGDPAYTVKISTENPKDTSKTVSALGYIIVAAPQATIKLERPKSYAILDSEKNYQVQWNGENADETNGAEVEVKVVKNGTEVKKNVTNATGTMSIPLDKVSQLKDVYTITAKIKNSGDEAYSYDSYVLTVYNSKALKIWVEKQEKNNIKLENESWVKTKTSEELVALARKIDLTTNISINNGKYDYGTISDQIVWDSENLKIASVNYSRAGRTRNITDYDYTSYSPETNFVLSGLNNGNTIINATHKQAQMKATLGVEVERLDNKLFLFQIMPKVKTSVTYVNGDGLEKTIETDDKGAFAIYEPNGIKSDLSLKSTYNGDTYLGTLYNYNLVSGERDGAIGELYPINNFVMRKPAKVELNFLAPNYGPSGNSKPIYTVYEGEVIIRGGVYKNGKYCEGTEISDNIGTIENPITPTETVKVKNGVYTKQFDISKFWSREGNETSVVEVIAGDFIQYVFEIQFKDNKYKPQIIKVNGNLSGNDIVKYGESIVKLEEPKKGEENKPFISSQFMDRYKQSKRLDNIKQVKENIGISPQTPRVKILTQTLWWGTDLSKTNGAMEFYNENEVALPTQSYKTFKYPFATMLVTEHETVIDKENIWVKDAKQRGKITMKVINDDKTLYSSTKAPYSVRNMMDITDLSKDPDELKAIEKDLQDSIIAQSIIDQPDDFAQSALDFVGNIKFGNDNFSLTMAPTSDPTKFTGIINLMAGEDVMEGPGSNEGFSLMAPDDDVKEFGVAKAATNKAQDTVTEMVGAVKDMLEDEEESDFSFKYQIGGYFTCSIEYNFDTEKWVVKPIGGGIRAGVSGAFSHTDSQLIGGMVPVTYEVALGAAVRVEFDAHMLYDPVSVEYSQKIKSDKDIVKYDTGTPAGAYTQGGTVDYFWNKNDGTVTDYLTNLKLYAYIYAFGGLGFDSSIVALKVGLFGQLELTADNKFLNRNYLDPVIANAVSPYGKNDNTSQTEKALNGTNLEFKGQVGVKFVAKLLFISVEATLASLKHNKEWQFRNLDKINEYWKKTTGDLPTPNTLSLATQRYAESIGLGVVPYVCEPQLEDRSYLEDFKRIWNKKSLSPSKVRKIDDSNKAPTLLQSNAYPYADPIMADDGSMFAYLSDNGSDSVWDTTANFATGSGDVGYEDKGNIDSEKGFGDAQLSFQGSNSSGIAAWTRLTSKINVREGEELTSQDQSIMMNSTDIYASIFKDNTWTTKRITENATPDLAPVVATNGNKAIVAWRSVYAADANNVMDFSGKDSIMYRTYDGSQWSEPVMLYNGANGAVLGLKAAMLSDGTVAITYVIEAVEETAQVKAKNADIDPNSNNEIVYAVIDGTGTIVNNVRLTNDKESDQNPDITTIKVDSDKSKEERFLLGWYRVERRYNKDTDSYATASDIRLSAIDKDGNITEDIPSSLSAISPAQNIGSNFKLVQMENTTNSLENLSVLWVNKDEATGSDTIKGIKFVKDKDELYTSAVLDVAEMPIEKDKDGNVTLYTQIDSFDAYVSGEDEVKVIIVGSEYKQSDIETEIVKDSDGNDVAIPVVNSQTKMYTATETYGNKAKMSVGDINTNEIISGFTLPIPFRVTNQGKDRINKVDITVNGNTTSVATDIYPGTSAVVNVDYDVPAKVVDVQYSGKGTFTNGKTLDLVDEPQTIVLAIPDLGITGIETISEQDGSRGFAIGLYNTNSSKLKDSGNIVKVALYDSSTYEASALVSDVMSISDNDELDRIDRGALTSNLYFDVKSYINRKGLSEIPNKGIELFAKVWVEKGGTEVAEFVGDNNFDNIICENLVLRSNGELVKVDVEQTQENQKTKAMLTLQNLSMQPSQQGNVVVNLLDSDKKIIETKYLSNNELISLQCEEVKTQEFVFDQAGAEVQACFFNALEGDMVNTLQTVSLSGVPFTFNNEQSSYTATAENLESTNVTITSNNANAVITLKNGENDLLSGTGVLTGTIPLASGENDITITVTPNGAGSTPLDYKIMVTNTRIPTGNSNLSSLSISNGISNEVLTPSFDPAVTAYTATTNQSNITVYATPNDHNATVTGTGLKTLNVGTNTLIVSVKAQDNTIKNYTIVVTYTAGGGSSIPTPTVPLLSSLGISKGTLTPIFNSKVQFYKATVENNVDSIDITATSTEIGATISGAGTKDLKVGLNTFVITVIGASGGVNTYTINVTREEQAKLSSIQLSAGTLSPSFKEDVTSYTATVPYDVGSVEISAIGKDKDTIVSGTGVKKLAVGDNRVTIKATSKAGKSNSYTIVITREEKQTYGDLDKAITITNTIKPIIDSKGNAKVTITKEFVEKSINEAREKFGDEIEVEDINIIANVSGKKVSGNFNIVLSKDAQNILIAKQVNSIAFKTNYAQVAFDLDTIKSIAKTAKANVTISVKPVQYDKLSMKLKGIFSKRPVYDISVNYTKTVNGANKAMTVSKFSKGEVTISIPYTLHKVDNNGKLLSNGVKEKSGNIYAVYLNSKGNATYIRHSSYDESNKNVVFKTDHLSIYGVGYKLPTKKVSDTSKHAAASDIDFVLSRGLMDCTSTTKFSPNSPMTRAMLAKALAVLSGDDLSKYKKSSFTDVKTGSKYMKYIEWAVDSDKGILKGTSSSKFSPNKAVTREELAVILKTFMDLQYTGKTLPITRETVEYDDLDKISDKALNAVVAMQQMGIMVGKNGNKFDPDTAVTRAQVASIIRRYIELSIDTATAQCFDKNDSGKRIYYENGALATGKLTIDLITYTFSKDGVVIKTEIPYIIHTIKKGDSLQKLAKTYKVTLNDILKYNNITAKHKFALGDEIMVPKKSLKK